MTEETFNVHTVETGESSDSLKFSVDLFEGVSVNDSDEMPVYKIVLEYIFAVMVAVTIVNLAVTALAYTPIIILLGVIVISSFSLIGPYTDSITVNIPLVNAENIGDKLILLVIIVTSVSLLETHASMLVIDPIVVFAETYYLHISALTVLWIMLTTRFNLPKYKNRS